MTVESTQLFSSVQLPQLDGVIRVATGESLPMRVEDNEPVIAVMPCESSQLLAGVLAATA